MRKLSSIFYIFIGFFALLGFADNYVYGEPCNFQKNGVEYIWEIESDYFASKKVFLEAFTKSYENLLLEVLKKPSREEMVAWLEEVFEKVYTHHNSLKDTLWLSAKIDGDIVGFLVIDIAKYPEEIYLAQLVVDPSYQRQYIASSMVKALLQQFSDCDRFFVITRNANETAKRFYTFLGFTPTAAMREGYSSEFYTGFEYNNI